ncbi:MAG: hypothetical protein C4583_18035 [Anaerolineaceae bacterium]|nr:MAG: hypothetical protein C4583_18035 [Anaerolineaceae bacterium]
MTIEITEKKQCECCGQIEEGNYHKFYYGKRLKADEKKELQTQIVQIGGSKSVYLCSRCLRKGFIEDPQVAIMLITFVVFSAALIILYGLDFLGIMTLADKDSMSPLAVLAMPFILALAINFFTGYFIFDGFFSFIYTFQAIKASNIYKKELAKQGFGIMYAPKQYRAMLQQGLCQKDPNEKEESRPEAIQEKNANEAVSTEAAPIGKSKDSEAQKKEDANLCPRCQGDSNVMFYCKECGYTDKSRSFIIVFGILLAIGIGVQGLFAVFSQNASLWLEIAKIACCGGPGIILAVWGIQEVLSRGNYERWKQRHSQEMDKLVDFHTQNPTASTEEIAQFMNRKHGWVEFILEEMEKAERITRQPRNNTNAQK